MNFLNYNLKKSRGFTLVEVLVVIGIVAILSTLVYASISDTRAKSRDAQKIADVSNIQLSLSMYYNQNGGEYPTSLDLLVPKYLPQIPNPIYKYVAFGKKVTAGTMKCSMYHMGVALELPSGQIDPNLHFDSTRANPQFNPTDPLYKYEYCLVGASGIKGTDPVLTKTFYDVRP